MKQIRPSPPPQLPSFQTFNLQTMALAHLRIGTPMNSWLSRGLSSHDCSAPSSGQGRVRDLRSPLFPQTTSPMVTRMAPSEDKLEEPPPLQRLRVPAELEWKPPTTRPFEERRDGRFDNTAFYCHDPADSQLPYEPDSDTEKVVKPEPVKRESRVRQLPRVTEYLAMKNSEHSEKEWQNTVLPILACDDGNFLAQKSIDLSSKYEHYIIHSGIGQGKACDHLPSKLNFHTWYILNPRVVGVFRKRDVGLIQKNGDVYEFPDDDDMPFLNVVSNDDGKGVTSYYTFGRAGISEGLRNQHIVEGKEVWYQVFFKPSVKPIEGKVVCLANGTVFEISMKPEECPLCLGRPGDNKSGIANAGHGYIFNVCHPCYEAYNSKSGKLALRIKALQSAEVVDDEPEKEPVKVKVLKRPVEVEVEAPRTKSRIMRMPVKTDHYKPLETVKIRKPPLKPSIGSDYRAPVKLPKSDDEPVKVKSRKLPVKAAVESDSEDEAESEPEVSLDNAEGQIQFVEDILTSLDGFINLNKIFNQDQRKALNTKIGRLYEKLDNAY